jgi:hypothetical protein
VWVAAWVQDGEVVGEKRGQVQLYTPSLVASCTVEGVGTGTGTKQGR